MPLKTVQTGVSRLGSLEGMYSVESRCVPGKRYVLYLLRTKIMSLHVIM